MLVFSVEEYSYLKDELLKLNPSKFKDGKIERKKFPDGELYQRIETDVKNKDVLLIGGTSSDRNTLELYDLGCALSKYGAKSLSIFIPYYGYSTMERAVKNGEIVGAKTRARLLSAIPQSKEGTKIYLLDLHSEGIPYYFEGNVVVSHVYAKNLILKKVQEIKDQDDQEIILGSTDAGRAKWVESLANDFGCDSAFVYKKRLSGSETKITGINANVSNKHVIIYDDMIRTGGSLIQAANAYKNAGATKVSAIATHGIFPSFGSNDFLSNLDIFNKIYCSNSHPRTNQIKNNSRIETISIVGLINNLF